MDSNGNQYPCYNYSEWISLVPIENGILYPLYPKTIHRKRHPATPQVQQQLPHAVAKELATAVAAQGVLHHLRTREQLFYLFGSISCVFKLNM